MTYSTTTTGPAATLAVAARLAPALNGGEVIELRSDLGGGKTTFVQGLAGALGYIGPVTSPTFTLSQIYVLPDGRELHHYDLYRLSEAGVVGDELGEDIGDEHVIIVIEWAGVAKATLPADRLIVEFTPTADDARELVFSATGPRAKRLVEAVRQ